MELLAVNKNDKKSFTCEVIQESTRRLVKSYTKRAQITFENATPKLFLRRVPRSMKPACYRFTVHNFTWMHLVLFPPYI